jgi:hypothetical protein
MPMNRSLYPKDWEIIATEVKEAANWECQECGRPCRKPGQTWCDFVHELVQTCDLTWYHQTYEEKGQDIVEKPQKFTLTVAHLDHVPSNCGGTHPEGNRSNLKALCSGCHLRYDVRQMALKKRLKREREGQMKMF